MAEYPSLPLFTDAFISDTIHLNAAQTGAYLMLLMCAWRTKSCSLPNDDKILARLARMSPREWSSNKDIILSFWCVEGGEIVQKRLLDERKFANDKRDQAVRAGKASALKRKERHSTGVPTERQRKPNNPTPTPTKKEKIYKKESLKLEDLSIDHVKDWLVEKRVNGKYLTIDEFELLEMFKDYCLSKKPNYKDYIAAFRNAFKWQNAPKKGENHAENRQYRTGNSKQDRAREAIQRGLDAFPDPEPYDPETGELLLADESRSEG